MAIAVNPDGSLVLARRQLRDAVAALAEPVPVAGDGGYRWSPPLYAELRDALTGRRSVRRAPGWRSRTPLRIPVLALLVEIDSTVRRWQPDGKGTVDRLHVLSGRSWRPQDCRLIDDYCARLQRWVLDATALLAPPGAGVPADALPPLRRELRPPRHGRRGEGAHADVTGLRGGVHVSGVRQLLGAGPVRVAGKVVGVSGAASVICWVSSRSPPNTQPVRRRISGSFPQPTYSTL